ncbi:MAG: ABC transporter ATP-binding protein [Prevotella sp.]|jgi:ABC-2 type transport system ATP-binding protein|nr:ABC transporter ATP-binding protein [Prevotella sp.]MCI1282619.1 ABC transporter ATP-binding protein [Prevotella sp.]
MLEVENVTFSYSDKSHPVFKDISLSLSEGNIYGLLGKNGMGKSTLLYLMSGLLRPQKGRVEFLGKPVVRHNSLVLQELYIVPEEFDFPQLNLEQIVAMHADFYPHFSKEVFLQCLSDLDLKSNSKLKNLSMGQKKKVKVSLALASGASLLLMDEPTNGLDISSKSLFRKAIATYLGEQSTLIIATHQVHDVESMLEHLIILDEGKVLMNEAVGDLTKKYCFSFSQAQEKYSDAIYSEPSLQGNAVIRKRTPQDEETALNLELLFNAVTKGLIK